MQLSSHGTQARVELSVIGYQFPDIQVHGERDWDANWLRVGGAVAQPDGRAWTFDNPCLTTWEAEKLASWLTNVAAGTVPPSPFGTDQPAELLVFTEPNLAFGLEAGEDDRLRIRVHFNLEALPPWLQRANRPDLFEYFVVIGVLAVEVAQAAEDWALNLLSFPKR